MFNLHIISLYVSNTKETEYSYNIDNKENIL